MTHRSDPRLKAHLPLMCLIVLALASPATAEWKEKVLYSFLGVPDGSVPIGGIVFDSAGNLYGTTQDGGASTCHSANQCGTGNCVLLGSKLGCGTVFELSPPAQKGGAWTESILYSFPTAKQGYFPW